MDSDAGELAARWRAIAAEQARVLGLVAGCRAGTSDDDELSASGVSKALKTVEIARATSGDAFSFCCCCGCFADGIIADGLNSDSAIADLSVVDR